MSEEKTVQQVEVELTGEHTHNGADYPVGAKIKVTQRQKAFLESVKKVKVATPLAKEA
ncbi:hypothetical protein JVX91_00560 [Pseudomonas sp. PDNC002]|uniref:DUF7210 family protein n=1 Tax=unclassified Pseudomonas TaxID=196821 RepID=UPI000A5EF54F|nr:MULTISPECIES: hypothetical protein [unclassified Pseudomonas]QRY79639.1 hypothetical protein JVX91_00560 [Pseudomonas sp. PDNC002]